MVSEGGGAGRHLRNVWWRALWRMWPLRRGRTRVFDAAWRGIGGTEIARDGFGSLLHLDLNNFIDAHVWLNGAFEHEEIRLLLNLAAAQKCRTFIDIGANIGEFSLALARAKGVKAVHAFEPDPRNYAQLLRNIALNGLDDAIRVWDVALGEETGEAEFFISETIKEIDAGKLNRGTSGLIQRPGRHTRSIPVSVRRLDDLIDLRGESIAIKIDVEGFESSVLAGMENLMRENRCVVLMEIFKPSRRAVEDWMKGVGYHRPYSPSPPGENFLFIPG